MHVVNLTVSSATTNLRLTIRPMIRDRTINEPVCKPSHCRSCSITESFETTGYISTGRRSVQQTADFERIASWIQSCDKNHNHAADISQAKQLPHFRLTDIRNKCIVEAHTSQKYAALSYTWDRFGQYRLLKDNVAELSKIDSLTRVAELMPVVKDAIVVCENLRIPYLWCDALCIIQDDTQQKFTQIRHMDIVYSAAYLTIVAAGPENAHGLSRVSRPNMDSAKSLIIAGRPYIIAEEPGHEIDRSKWATRAWTFQELVLSHRVLFFAQSEVIFSCNSGTCCESIGLRDGSDKPLNYQQSHQISHFLRMDRAGPPTQMNINVQWQCYIKVLELLSSYVLRELSYQSDYLNAFTGILRNEEHVLGPSLWGLPTKLLARALLWDVESPEFGRKRGARYTIVRRTGWPTWSWIGWSFRGGEITFRDSLAPPPLSPDHTCLLIRIYRSAAISPQSPINRGLQDDEESEGVGSISMTRFNQYLRQNGIADDQSHLSPHLKLELPGFTQPVEVSQLLVFSASVGHFRVSKMPVVPDWSADRSADGVWYGYRHCAYHEIYSVTGSDNNCQTYVELNVEWRSKQPDFMDFVLIGESWSDDSDVHLHVMLIERVDGICNRIAIPYKMQREQWLYGNPRTEVIVLG